MFPVGVVAVHVPFAKVNVVSILAWAANVADVNVAAGCTDAVMLAMLCCVAGALGVAIVVSRCHAVLSWWCAHFRDGREQGQTAHIAWVTFVRLLLRVGVVCVHRVRRSSRFVGRCQLDD